MATTLTPQETLRKKALPLLRAVLTSKAKVGIPLHTLCNEFEETCMEPLKFREMGYGTLEQFLRDIPDTCTISKGREGYYIVRGIPSKEDTHIYKLVSGQRAERKKKRRSTKQIQHSQVRRNAFYYSQKKRQPLLSLPPTVKKPQQTTYKFNNYMLNNNNNKQNLNLFSTSLFPPSSATKRHTANTNQVSHRPRHQDSYFVPPRFLRQNQNNQASKSLLYYNNNVTVLSDDESKNTSFAGHGRLPPIGHSTSTGFFGNAYLPSGERIVLKPATSIPNISTSTTLSPEELAILESRLRTLLERRPNGLWATRLRPEYKDMFKEDVHDNIRQVIQNHFLNFIRIDSPIPNREILYLVKQQVKPAPTPAPVTNIKMPAVTPITHNTQYQNLQVTFDTSYTVRNDDVYTPPATPTDTLSNGHKRNSLSPPRKEELIIPSIDAPIIGEELKVFVCHVENLNRFFVQLADSAIEAFVNDMQSIYEGPSSAAYNIKKPRLGEYCCARYSRDNLWFRAKVLSVKEQKNIINESYRCHVMYVDYGNDEIVVSTELKHLTKDLCQLPAQAILCSLDDLFLIEDNNTTPEAVYEKFKEITLDVELTMHVKKIHGSLSVDLVDASGQSVSDVLCDDGLARRSTQPSRQSIGSSSSSVSSISPASSSTDLSEHKGLLSTRLSLVKESWVEFPPEEDYHDALVSNVNTTTDITVIMLGVDYFEKLEKLETLMGKYFDDISVLPSSSLIVGNYYVVYSDDTWCRVKLLINTDDECEVLLVDHGNKTIVSLDELRDLPMKFRQLPFQAISCSLANVPETYDPEILQYLTDLTLGKIRLVYISERPSENQNKYIIELYDTTEPDVDININEELLNKIKSENNLEPQLPGVGEGHCQAYVAHISSNGDFFIQLFGPGLQRLEILMEDMTSHFSQKTRATEIVSRPEVGTICCAKCDNTWYRGSVRRVLKEERKVEVEFIDYGNIEIIPMLLIRKPNAISEKVVSVPVQAVKCKLDGLECNLNEQMVKDLQAFYETFDSVLVEVLSNDSVPVIKIIVPSDKENEPPVDSFEKFKQMQEEEEQIVTEAYKELQKSENSPNKSSLLDEVEAKQLNNTAQEQIDTSLLPEQAESTDSSHTPATLFSLEWGIPEMVLKEARVEGIIIDTSNPFKFSFVPTDMWTQLEEMHMQMIDFYGTSSEITSAELQANKVCAVFHVEHEVWYRALIQAKVEDKFAVKFPDFSSVLEMVAVDCIRPLEDVFKVFPFLAIHCSLSGIEPISGLESWSSEACDVFHKLAMNETFRVEIMSLLDRTKPYQVRLHGANEQGKHFIVNDQLVKMGLARQKHVT